MKALKQKYATLLAEKKKMYSEYRSVKENMKKINIAKANVDQFVYGDPAKKTKEMER